MRTCDSCGFENAEPGKPCPLCGASEVVHAMDELSTLLSPATPTPTAGARGEAAVSLGQVLGERYRVDSLLGRGGMGHVFRVTDVTTGQGEVFRRLVDYEQDCAERAEAESRGVTGRLSRWLG